MSDMWMPAHTTVPPGTSVFSAAGTSAPTGAKISAASSDRGAGRSESVDAEPLGLTGETQRAVSDQPRAQQRRSLLVVVAVGQREHVAGVSNYHIRVAAVQLIPGEPGVDAQVLPAGPAGFALAAGPAQPRNADPGADSGMIDPAAPRDHSTDDLVARYDRMIQRRQLAVDDVKIGPAHTAAGDLDQNLPGAWRRIRPRRWLQRLPRTHQLHGEHSVPSLWANQSRCRLCLLHGQAPPGAYN